MFSLAFQSIAEWFAMGKKRDMVVEYLRKAKDVMQQVKGEQDKHANAKG